jgi:hypothetical protein
MLSTSFYSLLLKLILLQKVLKKHKVSDNFFTSFGHGLNEQTIFVDKASPGSFSLGDWKTVTRLARQSDDLSEFL